MEPSGSVSKKRFWHYSIRSILFDDMGLSVTLSAHAMLIASTFCGPEQSIG
jgi:hypothetical protein